MTSCRCETYNYFDPAVHSIIENESGRFTFSFVRRFAFDAVKKHARFGESVVADYRRFAPIKRVQHEITTTIRIERTFARRYNGGHLRLTGAITERGRPVVIVKIIGFLSRFYRRFPFPAL